MYLFDSVLFLFLGIEVPTVQATDDPIDLSRGLVLPNLLEQSVDLNKKIEVHEEICIDQPIDLSNKLVKCSQDTEKG